VGIRAGIPHDGVDPVQDPGELVPPRAEDLLQPLALSEDLARVGRGNGGDPIRGPDPALEEVDLVPSRHELPADAVQAKVLSPRPRERSLVGEVVDREHRPRRSSQFRAEVHRDEGGVPIVGVDHVGKPSTGRTEVERGPRQKREPFQLIGVSPASLAVDPRAVEQGIAPQGVQRDLASGERTSERLAGPHLAPHGDGEGHDGGEIPRPLRHHAVFRGYHRDLHPEVGQGPRQGGRDIAQPPYLGIRGHLCRNVQNAHRTPPP